MEAKSHLPPDLFPKFNIGKKKKKLSLGVANFLSLTVKKSIFGKKYSITASIVYVLGTVGAFYSGRPKGKGWITRG